jgi:hypothetical protein
MEMCVQHIRCLEVKCLVLETLLLPYYYYYYYYYLIRIIESGRMRWARHVARMGEKRNVYRLLVGRPERKRPLGRQSRRWIDNIKMDFLEIGLSVVDWIGLAQDR